jgi:hypothetical protein
MNKDKCHGCSNDYYNREGNSDTGECWMLQSARIIERVRIGIWERPPYKKIVESIYHCHQPDNGTMWISPNDSRIKE